MVEGGEMTVNLVDRSREPAAHRGDPFSSLYSSTLLLSAIHEGRNATFELKVVCVFATCGTDRGPDLAPGPLIPHS
jgi:hypothetical protein